MNNYKLIETKLWSALSALTSGVITSLIYDALSSSSYMVEIDGEQYMFTSIGISFWEAGGLILSTFLMIWALISVIIPLLLRLRKRFTYDKIKRINAKELIRTLDETKESVVSLYPVFVRESTSMSDACFVNLYNRDLVKIILRLHSDFLPHNKKLRKIIEGYFRHQKHSSSIAIDRNISSYELDSLIALLREMVQSAKTNTYSDELMKKDCVEMEKALNDLNELVNRMK